MKSLTSMTGVQCVYMEIEVYLTKRDVEKMLEVIERFPEAKTFKLEQEGGSGIGTITTMTIDTNINGYEGEFTVEMAGVAKLPSAGYRDWETDRKSTRLNSSH